MGPAFTRRFLIVCHRVLAHISGADAKDQMIVKGVIGGKSARILIDTGASISFVSLKFVKFSAVETVECE
eukprot:SAG31_NODE_18075_length_647_cov_2.815693_1_plen_69_part_01